MSFIAPVLGIVSSVAGVVGSMGQSSAANAAAAQQTRSAQQQAQIDEANARAVIAANNVNADTSVFNAEIDKKQFALNLESTQFNNQATIDSYKRQAAIARQNLKINREQNAEQQAKQARTNAFSTGDENAMMGESGLGYDGSMAAVSRQNQTMRQIDLLNIAHNGELQARGIQIGIDDLDYGGAVATYNKGISDRASALSQSSVNYNYDRAVKDQAITLENGKRQVTAAIQSGQNRVSSAQSQQSATASSGAASVFGAGINAASSLASIGSSLKLF